MLDIISPDKFLYMPTLSIKIAEGEWIQLIFREGYMNVRTGEPLEWQYTKEEG